MNKSNLFGTLVLFLFLSCSVHATSTSYVQANGQTIAKVNETGVYYYHTDHLGSTSAVTDSDGEVVEEQVNLPFGEPIQGGERYGFTGKEFEPDLGLNYFMARYYNPNSGRFLNSDPAQDGVNWFAYAGNNPLKYIDPTGNEIEVADEWMSRILFWKRPGKYLRTLIRQVDEKSGVTLGVHKEQNSYLFYVENIDETRGSPHARRLILDAVNAWRRFILKIDNDEKSRDLGRVRGNVDNPDEDLEIYLAMAKFERFIHYGINPRTCDASMTFFHELSHAVDKTKDPTKKFLWDEEKIVYSGIGGAEEFVNLIRKDLKLPLKLQYESAYSSDGSVWKRFDEGDVWLGKISKERDKQLWETLQFWHRMDYKPNIKNKEDSKPRRGRGCLFGCLF